MDKVEFENGDGILSVLEQICTFAEYDRAYIAFLSGDESRYTYSAHWSTGKVPLHSTDQDESDVLILPKLVKELNEQEYLLLSKEDASDHSWVDKKLLEMQEISFFLILPIKHNNKLLGFMDYSAVNRQNPFNDEEQLALATVAQLFATKLNRKKTISSLMESDQCYKTMYSIEGTAQLVLDNNHVITMANLECETLFGCKSEDLPGTKWSDYFNEEIPVSMERPVKFINVIGATKYITINSSLIGNTDTTVVTLFDATDLYQVRRALESISACNMAMIQSTNEMELIQSVCEKIVEVGGYYLTWVGYVTDDENRSIQPVARAGHELDYLNGIKIYLNDPVLGNGPFGRAVKTRKTIITKSLAEDKTFAPWRDKAMRIGGRSLISIPLYVDGQEPFGVLGIGADETDVFDEAEVRVLTEMASDLTYGIMSIRARNERDNHEKTLKENINALQMLFTETIQSLSNVVEMRDAYTLGHQRRVAQLAAALAQELGMTHDEIEGVYIAGTIHDIGKMKLPTILLSKPGKLSAIEYELIKTHSKAGYDVIEGIEFPWPIAQMILQHHEKMDGSGYPNGLMEESILFSARIIAVADVVEAMSFNRPYRPALGLDKALDEIIENRGTKYDSVVVDACVDLFRNKGFEFV